MGFTFTDKSPAFIAANREAMDRALARAANDITNLAKRVVPKSATKAAIKKIKKAGGKAPRFAGTPGALQSSIKPQKKSQMAYRVIANMVYARYQEFGGDGKGKVVKNYTKVGTGPHYLGNSGAKISKNMPKYLKQEGASIVID